MRALAFALMTDSGRSNPDVNDAVLYTGLIVEQAARPKLLCLASTIGWGSMASGVAAKPLAACTQTRRWMCVYC